MRILLVALLTLTMAGCASKGFRLHLFPVAEVRVVNDCPGSVLDIESIHEEHGAIAYGEKMVVVLERFMGRDNSMVLTALDVSDLKRGSISQSFYADQNSSREYAWHVSYLQGGRGCERVQYR